MTSRGILATIGLVLVAGGAAYGAWKLQDRNWSYRLEQQKELHARETTALITQAQGWAEAVAKRNATQLLRAFVAGIQPSLLAERSESLEQACVTLLRIEGVRAIHLLRPDGTVIYSSDAKFATGGSVDDRATCALAATELTARPGNEPHVVEMATPLADSGTVVAFVWMKVLLSPALDAERPDRFLEPSPSKTNP